MPIKIELSITADDEIKFKRALIAYNDNLRDLSRYWEHYALPTIRESIAGQFPKSGAHEGLPAWTPLSARYASYKARRYPNTPILVRSGRLRNALAEITGDSIATIEPDRLTYGTSVPYALYHQRGTRKMPARPILRLSNPLKNRLMRLLRSYIDLESV